MYGRKLRFKIDWASLIVGSKFTILALSYFVFEGNFPSTSLRGAYIWKGDLTDGFLRYRIGGPIFAGAYTWRGLFSEFYGICISHVPIWLKLLTYPASCCWLTFQSIFNPCNPLQQTDDGKQ